MKSSLAILLAAAVSLATAAPALASTPPTAFQLRTEAYRSLSKLHVAAPQTARLGHQAYAVAVFPAVRGFGFMVGAEAGNGVLFMGQNAVDYYKIHIVAGGLTFGWRSYGLAIYFMTQDAFDRFIKNKGTEANLGGWVSLDTQDFSAHKSKLHFQKDVIKYIYNEEGMMFHLGPQLTRVTEAALSR